MVGLTSISFRGLRVDDIIAMCKKAEVDVIEWGSDVHVPVGNIGLAKEVGIKTRKEGIKTLSYGTYYKLAQEANPSEAFTLYVKTAEALGASIIRIWAGAVTETTDVEAMIEANIKELKVLTKIAKTHGMTIGLEYHRGTVTETKEGARRLLEGTGAPNLKTYWQMNPDVSHEERLEEIKLLKKDICNVHTFYWMKDEKGKDERCTIEVGTNKWIDYWDILKECNCPAMIEFVKDDMVEQFYEDVKALKKIVG